MKTGIAAGSFALRGTVDALLGEARFLLQRAGLPAARQDAEWLLANLLGVRRWTLHLEPERLVPADVVEAFAGLLDRRKHWEPLQHLLGWEEFCGLRLRVSPEALIPRPETELLVAWALESLRGGSPSLGIDVGTGCGAIACALAREMPGLRVVGIDVSAGALAVAAENVRALGLEGRVALLQGDLFGPVARVSADLVIANPPYIPSGGLDALPVEVREYEPRLALDGGPDGMTHHRRILIAAPDYLRPGGWLLMEAGEGQAEAIAMRLSEAGFEAVEVRRDLQGKERMVGGRRR